MSMLTAACGLSFVWTRLPCLGILHSSVLNYLHWHFMTLVLYIQHFYPHAQHGKLGHLHMPLYQPC